MTELPLVPAGWHVECACDDDPPGQTLHGLFEDQVAREARLISECADSADGKEGVAAFLGKRRPEFA